MNYIKIDNDMWDDHNKVWGVISSVKRPGSTAVDLVLEDDKGNVVRRTVAENQIERLEAKDW